MPTDAMLVKAPETSVQVVRWRDGALCKDRVPLDEFEGELLRSEFVGLCPAEAGLAPDWPFGLGHELVVKRETRHYVLAPFVVCGHCMPCGTGRFSFCLGVEVPSLSWQGHGGLGGTVALRDERFLVELPSTERPFTYTLAEPFAAGVAACNGIGNENTVVVGFGAVGLGAGLRRISEGAKVSVVGRHEWQLSLARRAGMEALNMDDSLPSAIAPHVVVATGSVSGLTAACRLVEPGGTIHLVGMNVDDGEWRSQAGGDFVFFRRGLTLKHHYMYTLQQLREAVRLVEEYESLLQEALIGPLDLQELGGQFPAARVGKRVIVAPHPS